MNTTSIGNTGENLAVDFLKKKKYSIVDRNYRAGHGEIDIIAKSDKTLVFVEVKTRNGRSIQKFGSGKFAVDAKKKSAFISAVNTYLYQHAQNGPCRIDVIEITLSDPPEIKHYENAFGYQSTPYSYRKY